MNGVFESTLNFVLGDKPSPGPTPTPTPTPGGGGSGSGLTSALNNLGYAAKTATSDPMFMTILVLLLCVAVSVGIIAAIKKKQAKRAIAGATNAGTAIAGAAGKAAANGVSKSTAFFANLKLWKIFIVIAVIAATVTGAIVYAGYHTKSGFALDTSNDLNIVAADVTGTVDYTSGEVTFGQGKITNNGTEDGYFTDLALVRYSGIDDENCVWTVKGGGVTLYEGKSIAPTEEEEYFSSATANNSSNKLNDTFKQVLAKNGGSLTLTFSVSGLSGQTAKNLAGKNILKLKYKVITNEGEVTLDKNGGTGGDDTVKATAGEVLPDLTSLPTRENYYFMGYTDQRDAGQKYIDREGHGIIPWDKETTGQTLYAFWSTELMYDVVFDPVGGTPTPEVQSVAAGGKVTKPDDPEKTGYTLEGWYTDSAYTTKWDFDTDTVQNDMTLYAKWTDSADTEYRVMHWKLNEDGSRPLSPSAVETLTGATGQLTDAQPRDYGGYTANTIFQQIIQPDGNTIVDVTYSLNIYCVTFYTGGLGTTPNKQYVHYQSLISKPDDPYEPGYFFRGWYQEPSYDTPWRFTTDTMPYEDITLYAKWYNSEDTQYKVEHYLKNIDGTTSVEPAETEIKTGITDDYTEAKAKEFTGFTAPEPETIEQQRIKGDGSTVIQIIYNRNTYKLKFDMNIPSDTNAEVEEVPTQEVLYGDHATEPGSPSRPTYDFNGWFKDQGGENQWLFGLDTMPAHDITLYANWVIRGETIYKVNHYKLGIDGSRPETPTDVDTKTGIAGEMTAATAKYYLGYTNEDFTQQTIESNTVIDIDYDLNYYNVNFDNMGHGREYESLPVQYTDKITKPDDPSATGCTFAGWYKEPECINIWDFTTDTMPANNITLYARWIFTNYNVTWNPGEGVISSPCTMSYTTDTDTFVFADATMGGYRLVGWRASASTPTTLLTGWDTSFVYTMSTLELGGAYTGNVTMTAVWTDDPYTISWDLNGGCWGDTTPSTSYTVDDVYITCPMDVTYGSDAATFAGWRICNTKGESCTGWQIGDIVYSEIYSCYGNTGCITMQAVWEPLSPGRITLNLNGGLVDNTIQTPAGWLYLGDGVYQSENEYAGGTSYTTIMSEWESVIPYIYSMYNDNTYSIVNWESTSDKVNGDGVITAIWEQTVVVDDYSDNYYDDYYGYYDDSDWYTTQYYDYDYYDQGSEYWWY